MKKKKTCLKLIIVLVLFKTTGLFAQVNPLGEDNSFIALDRGKGFFIVSVLAVGSYFLSKSTPEETKINYYQIHTGYFNGDGYDVLLQNFGIERMYSHWFSIRVEGNIQEFIKNNASTFGVGAKVYARWILLGKKRLSPFFEYGVGPFLALEQFPTDGSRFTFNSTYGVGLEYTLANKNKIRLDVNFIHHSNASLADRNPGFDGNGITFSYSWFWN